MIIIFIIILLILSIIYFLNKNINNNTKTDHNHNNKNSNKICIAIPTTSNGREWNKIEDSYLYKSINIFNLYKNIYHINIFISYDYDDKLYSKDIERDKLQKKYPDLNIKWFSNNFEKGDVVSHWNFLYYMAVKNHCKYTLLIGDDIIYPNNNKWLTDFINSLKKNNDIGISGGYSKQEYMTQFLLSDIHYQIFGYAFHPEIKNWSCDLYLFELYPDKYINFLKNYFLDNAGGGERYIPNNADNYKELVKEDKLKLKNLI